VSELFLFVRPPRPLWPYNGPSTAFWPPLAFASLAAALRDGVRDVRVEILDAPALSMGWRTLAAELTSPGALATGSIAVVVHGEGEETIVELVEALRAGQRADLAGVAGISFMDGDQVVTTVQRALIADLDRLPYPAYDLLPVASYGRNSRNHPDFGALELSRGCVGSCGFCVLWRQMGRSVGGRMMPQLRTKSPERAFDEIQRLQRQFGRRYIGWVDPCFNADPRVPARLAELLLAAGLRVGQSAWVRADGVVRDAASGALERMIRSGINEVHLGVERPDDDSLHELNKTVTLDATRRAFEILAREYPQVYTAGSFIYGLPGDTPATMRAIYRLSNELMMDKAFFIPLTPLPGTPFWQPELWDATGVRFRQFDFLPSAVGDPARAVLDRALLSECALRWTGARLRSYLRAFWCADARRRRMQWRLAVRSTLFVCRGLLRALNGHDATGPMVLPRWYES